MRFEMKTIVGLLLLFAGNLSIMSHGLAQSRDIRPYSEYDGRTGKLRLKYEYYHDMWSEQDVRHGRCSRWSRRGLLIEDCTYADGELEGLRQLWTKKGELLEVGHWKQGKHHGRTAIYDRHERLESEIQYQDGLPNGLLTLYYNKGNVARISQYQQGLLHGHSTLFKRNGTRKSIVQYEHGRKLQPERPAKIEGRKSKLVIPINPQAKDSLPLTNPAKEGKAFSETPEQLKRKRDTKSPKQQMGAKQGAAIKEELP